MFGFGSQVWDDNDPCFVISVAARMVRVHSQTLRYYEREVNSILPQSTGFFFNKT